MNRAEVPVTRVCVRHFFSFAKVVYGTYGTVGLLLILCSYNMRRASVLRTSTEHNNNTVFTIFIFESGIK